MKALVRDAAIATPPRRFKSYPAYKDSGVEWLGAIPRHWEVKRLKVLAPARINKQGAKPETTTYVGLEHVESWTGQLLLDRQPDVVDSVVVSFNPGDVLFGKLRPYLAKVARPDFHGVCTSELIPLRPTEEFLQGYLMYCLLSRPYIQWLDSLTYGTKMPRVSPDQVGSSPFSVPPKQEQRAIAAFLDRETARIDALVAKKERLIELLQEKRTALITRAVTKGLDPSVTMKDSGVEWLGEIPAGWQTDRLRHSVNRIEQGWSPDCENRVADDDEWAVLKAGCVNRGTFIEAEHKALPASVDPVEELEIRPSDLLMCRASGSRDLVGSVAIVRQCRPRLLLCDKMFRLHVDARIGDKDFLVFALNSRFARWQIESALSGGSGLANNIAQEVVKDLIMPRPQIDEQRIIAAVLKEESAKIDALTAKVREAVNRLRELRTALISAAVTGQIDVRGEVA